MPAYEYTCNDCKKDFTVFLSLKEAGALSRTTCPHCQGNATTKKFTGFFAKTSKKS